MLTMLGKRVTEKTSTGDVKKARFGRSGYTRTCKSLSVFNFLFNFVMHVTIIHIFRLKTAPLLWCNDVFAKVLHFLSWQRGGHAVSLLSKRVREVCLGMASGLAISWMQDCGLYLTDRTENYRASAETEQDRLGDREIAPYPLEIEIDSETDAVPVVATPNLYVSNCLRLRGLITLHAFCRVCSNIRIKIRATCCFTHSETGCSGHFPTWVHSHAFF